ncbi:MAG: ROK family protein [Deltaproteobacteria bacterium]
MARSHIIGIDLGGTNLKIGLCDASCAILRKNVLSTASFEHKEHLIDSVVSSVDSMIREQGISRSSVIGVGIGLPGPIDVEKGIVHYFPNIPGWREVCLRDILQKRIRMRVCVDNDANLMALAEFKAGAARGARNAVCITLGTGVGGGLIIEGRLFRGSTHAAGEVGHIPINVDGPECGCGAFGCVESYTGNRRIAEEVRRVFRKDIPLEEVSRMARRGDPRALKIWENAGMRLGVALAGVVNLLNPDVIVIGGGVANAGRVLFNSIKKTIDCRAMPMQARHVKVRRAELMPDAGIIGACLLVKEE